MQNIILTGFMGTGKTTVGKLLAQHLSYSFVDTDALIEQEAGCSVPTIFQEQGEAVFRQMETTIAQRLSQQNGLLISTGGGMMLNPANADALGRSGRIFCLVATPDEILSRLQLDTDNPRPLLAGPDPAKRVLEILAQRKERYGQFPQIQTTGKSPAQIVGEILAMIDVDLS